MAIYGPENNEELYHIGVKRRSGRYPWGSGKEPYQSNPAMAKKATIRKKPETFWEKRRKAQAAKQREKTKVAKARTEDKTVNANEAKPASQKAKEMSDEDQLYFSIDANNHMFFAFNRLINEKETLIINDDDTFDEKKKYLEIKREENNIKIIFHNNISNSYDKFNIFIKNIFNDGRSKMSSDVKSKLCKLFFELEEILQNKNHQYTLDEYYELLKSKNNIKEDNPFIKRLSCN